MRFDDLNLIPPLLRALHAEGYDTPTPIQAQAIPALLLGRDLLGIAQTGTGKTAAFSLPLLQRLATAPAPSRRPLSVRALVLTPTRELAAQVDERMRAYGSHLHLRSTAIYGGVSQRPQEDAIAAGVEVLVATPGRLLDLLGQRRVLLGDVEILVLDEADRMLDMGFLPAVQKIVAQLPLRRQTVFFSATMGDEPSRLADAMLRDPVRVAVTPPATTVERVAQTVYFVAKADKQALLAHVLADDTVTRALVFTRTKHGADRVATRLHRVGVDAAAIHADKSQRQRERALDGFRAGTTRVLVATDIAARGIDVDDVSLVVNFDLPNVPESYVHRIGRTARAGAEGRAVSFCDAEERAYLRDIERETRRAVPVVPDHPFAAGAPRPPADHAPHRSGVGRRGVQPPRPPESPDAGLAPFLDAPIPASGDERAPHRSHGPRPSDRRSGHGRPDRFVRSGGHGARPRSAGTYADAGRSPAAPRPTTPAADDVQVAPDAPEARAPHAPRDPRGPSHAERHGLRRGGGGGDDEGVVRGAHAPRPAHGGAGGGPAHPDDRRAHGPHAPHGPHARRGGDRPHGSQGAHGSHGAHRPHGGHGAHRPHGPHGSHRPGGRRGPR